MGGGSPARAKGDGRVKPGQDEEGWSRVITGGSASLVDQRAGALVGEQFEQHGVLHLAVDDDDALDALFQRIYAGLDLRDHAAGNGAVGDQLPRLLDRE